MASAAHSTSALSPERRSLNFSNADHDDAMNTGSTLVADTDRKRQTWRGLMAVARVIAENDEWIHGPNTSGPHFMGEPVTVYGVPDSTCNGRDGVFLGHLEKTGLFLVEVVVHGEVKRLQLPPANVHFPLGSLEHQHDFELKRRSAESTARLEADERARHAEEIASRADAARDAAEAVAQHEKQLRLDAEARYRTQLEQNHELKVATEKQLREQSAAHAKELAEMEAEFRALLAKRDADHREALRAHEGAHHARQKQLAEHLANAERYLGDASVTSPPPGAPSVVPRETSAQSDAPTDGSDLAAGNTSRTTQPDPVHRAVTEMKTRFHENARASLASAEAFLSTPLESLALDENESSASMTSREGIVVDKFSNTTRARGWAADSAVGSSPTRSSRMSPARRGNPELTSPQRGQHARDSSPDGFGEQSVRLRKLLTEEIPGVSGSTVTSRTYKHTRTTTRAR
eukprot:m.115771 g.115771  ORF g.115771 m.115771 type:complete len:461 (+) comp17156_c0_seq6:171-1553(+)